MKEKYIELVRERSYLLQTLYLYPNNREEIKKLDIEIEELKKKMIKEIK